MALKMRPGCEEGSPDDYDVIGLDGLIIGAFRLTPSASFSRMPP
jgi:hypothetical protein